MTNTFGFYVGQTVVTRRGKKGVVTAVGTDTVDVRFGGKVFTMKNGQLVDGRTYDKMGKGYSRQYHDR